MVDDLPDCGAPLALPRADVPGEVHVLPDHVQRRRRVVHSETDCSRKNQIFTVESCESGDIYYIGLMLNGDLLRVLLKQNLITHHKTYIL